MAERPVQRGDGGSRSRGRRGRDDRGRSTRPGDHRRASTHAAARPAVDADGHETDGHGVDPLATAADFGVSDDVEDAAAQSDSTEGGADTADAQPVRVRSARGARTHTPRPGLAASMLTRARGVNPRHAVIMAVVLAFVILTLAMPMRTYFSQRSEFSALRASNAQLHKEVAEYQQKVNEQGDPAYTEAKARSRLMYARPGETVMVLTFPGQEQRRAEAARAAAKARNPWYGNLWDSVATPVTKK